MRGFPVHASLSKMSPHSASSSEVRITKIRSSTAVVQQSPRPRYLSTITTHPQYTSLWKSLVSSPSPVPRVRKKSFSKSVSKTSHPARSCFFEARKILPSPSSLSVSSSPRPRCDLRYLDACSSEFPVTRPIGVVSLVLAVISSALVIPHACLSEFLDLFFRISLPSTQKPCHRFGSVRQDDRYHQDLMLLVISGPACLAAGSSYLARL